MIDLKTLSRKTTFDFESGEAILVQKPEGWSSFDVVNKIKKALKIRKIGHSGTLDPFASGLLILVTGKMTKEARRFQDMPKTYIGTIELGRSTNTLDPEGEFTDYKEVPAISSESVARTLDSFLGESWQEPPAYSALKIGGKRAYALARNNQKFRLEPRKIYIYELQLLDVVENELTVRVTCSKGTYIRALARDIARALCTVGYLKSLQRTQIGPYSIKNAVDVDVFIDTIKRWQNKVQQF